jgi:hypothetical protein
MLKQLRDIFCLLISSELVNPSPVDDSTVSHPETFVGLLSNSSPPAHSIPLLMYAPNSGLGFLPDLFLNHSHLISIIISCKIL